MKRAFSLVEVIVVIVILGVLSVGTFVSLKHLYIRTAKSKALSELSLESQILLNQISSLLQKRVPSSVIGYDGNTTFESIYTLSSTYHILEWIGLSSESFKKGDFSGFVDLDDSNASSLTISTPNSAGLSNLQTVLQNKFGISGNVFDQNLTAVVFAGSFDDGSTVYNSNFNSTFGWHGNNANRVFGIKSVGVDTIELDSKPDEIYEKYYIVDSAYAIARGEDINLGANCITNLPLHVDKNTLFLFYNYRPWRGETYCADRGSTGNKSGDVTILSRNIVGFEADFQNSNLFFNLTATKEIKGSENNVTISKQKVVF